MKKMFVPSLLAQNGPSLNFGAYSAMKTETIDNFAIVPMQKEMSGIYLVQLQCGEKKYLRKVEI